MKKMFPCQTDQCPFSLFDGSGKQTLLVALTAAFTCPALADKIKMVRVDQINTRAEIIYRTGKKQRYSDEPLKDGVCSRWYEMPGEVFSKITRKTVPVTCGLVTNEKIKNGECPHCGQNIKR